MNEVLVDLLVDLEVEGDLTSKLALSERMSTSTLKERPEEWG